MEPESEPIDGAPSPPEPGRRAAVAGLELLAATLAGATAVIIVGVLVVRWSQAATFEQVGQGFSSTNVLRTWARSLGQGPSAMLVAALLLIGLVAVRPYLDRSRRTLWVVVVTGLTIACAQGVATIDALFQQGGDGFESPTGSSPFGSRLGTAMGLGASAAIAGIVAWVAFTLLEQDRIARTGTASADDLADGPDDEDAPNS